MSPAHPTSLDPELAQRVNAAIDDIRAGRMVIVVDDEDRENEGDLTMAAEHITAEAVNFMAKHGRGLICLTLTEEAIARLGLPMMETPGRGGPPLGTAFTVSVEAKHGVTTGISAKDRAHTMLVAADPSSGPEDLVTPGHVFPLRARTGGVLVRTGQTEGSVDLARLAGCTPAGVICEIMNDDGTMARMPDLEVFAKEHGMRIVSIADLIEYRLQTERLVVREHEQDLHLDVTGSTWRAIAYRAVPRGGEILALVRGEIDGDDPVMCRVHRGHFIQDLFASSGHEGAKTLHESLRRIEREGRGVLVYLPPNGSVASELQQNAEPNGLTVKPDPVLREFGLGAQVLADLGVQRIRLLSASSRKIAGLGGYGLELVERIALFGDASRPQLPTTDSK